MTPARPLVPHSLVLFLSACCPRCTDDVNIACFENPLFDRVFLITSRRPSSVCDSAGAVLDYEGDSGDCPDEAVRLIEVLTIVTEVDTLGRPHWCNQQNYGFVVANLG